MTNLVDFFYNGESQKTEIILTNVLDNTRWEKLKEHKSSNPNNYFDLDLSSLYRSVANGETEEVDKAVNNYYTSSWEKKEGVIKFAGRDFISVINDGSNLGDLYILPGHNYQSIIQKVGNTDLYKVRQLLLGGDTDNDKLSDENRLYDEDKDDYIAKEAVVSLFFSEPMRIALNTWGEDGSYFNFFSSTFKLMNLLIDNEMFYDRDFVACIEEKQLKLGGYDKMNVPMPHINDEDGRYMPGSLEYLIVANPMAQDASTKFSIDQLKEYINCWDHQEGLQEEASHETTSLKEDL